MSSKRTLRRFAGGVAGALVLAAASHTAEAATDTDPPLPNVMLLVDTSGSMEFMSVNNASGHAQTPVCNPGAPTLQNDQSRWTDLVTVLTGEVQNYSCFSEPRSDTKFISEYNIGGADPYDKTYYLPTHRMMSGTCTIGPRHSVWPGTDLYDFPTNMKRFHAYTDDGTTAAADCGFTQSDDGLLDAFTKRARFGLMTFDPSTGAGTGVSGGTVDYTTGPAGSWSYFPNWWTGGTPATGNPDLCATSATIEVGARNPAAPPWEGRMIGFGDPSADDTSVVSHNQTIQDALLLMRPYGATPTAGLLSDANYFFTGDTFIDPIAPPPGQTRAKFGPKDDPFIAGGCRQSFIILLTDGQPNLDLRPACAGVAGTGAAKGHCPYSNTWEIAHALANPADPHQAVKTYVIGFALSQVDDPSGGPVPIKCDSITPAGSTVFDPLNRCVNPTGPLKSCCELARVAFEGGTVNPYFADDKAVLRQALSNILSQIAGSSTSRTTPVFGVAPTSVSGLGNFAAGFNFYSSFFVSTGSLWNGVLERQRYVCQSSGGGPATATLQAVDPAQGDRFSDNVNSSSASRPRNFYSYIPATVGTDATARHTTRTTPSSTDGLGTRAGTVVSGVKDTFIGEMPPATLEVTTPTSSTCTTVAQTVTAPDCRDRIMKWHLGDAVTVADGTVYSRSGAVFGSIYHSTPALSGPPSDFVRDPSYAVFQAQQVARPIMLYTATTDGQLHGFEVAPTSNTDTFKVNTKDNNELWSFFPPAVLPWLPTMFPGTEENSAVLDGAPVVRDVFFARSITQADQSNVAWATMLVAGYGSSVPGYYGIDVTKPVPVSGDNTTGPVFRWQIIDDADGNPLFGKPTRPTITTLYFAPTSGATPQEIAVAILPGGVGTTTGGAAVSRLGTNTGLVDGDWPIRGTVTPYPPGDPSRSVTIVRLDTGEVVRTFRNIAATISAGLGSVRTLSTFDSPMSGVPVVYPDGVGQIATRAYVGDADGVLWRFDLSSTDPSQWGASPFFDLYSGLGPTAGQPIETSPVLTVDSFGNVVVIASTGDQGTITASPSTTNQIWSISENPHFVSGSAGTVTSKYNWHLGRGTNEGGTLIPSGASVSWNTGERVTGPMSLFNGVVYFSTYRPPTSTSAACDNGVSTLWGVDYLQKADSGDGPRGRLVLDSLTSPGQAAYVQSDALIFGVGLNRTPSCYDTSSTTDPYLGYGTSTSVTNVNPGTFQLVVQTGNKGTSTSGAQTNTKAFTLPTPPPIVRVDSWAAVVE